MGPPQGRDPIGSPPGLGARSRKAGCKPELLASLHEGPPFPPSTPPRTWANWGHVSSVGLGVHSQAHERSSLGTEAGPWKGGEDLSESPPRGGDPIGSSPEFGARSRKAGCRPEQFAWPPLGGTFPALAWACTGKPKRGRTWGLRLAPRKGG